MRPEVKVIGALLCSLFMYVYLCAAVGLQFVNYKPSDVTEETAPIYEKMDQRAKLGAKMYRPFEIPMRWFSQATRGTENQGLILGLTVMGCGIAIHWVVLPLVYGTMLFATGCLVSRFGRWLFWREPEPASDEWVP